MIALNSHFMGCGIPPVS